MVYKKGKECKKCGKCDIWKELSCFLKREDREGYYSFCSDCMTEQCRTVDYPTSDKRGGGNLELKPQD